LTIVISKVEAFYTKALFFLFGVGVIMIAPRTPDLKANLHVNNGTLGSLISIGTFGAFFSLIYMGQIVHRFGVRRVLTIAATWLYIAMAVQPHIHSIWLFALDQIACGIGWAGYHITINSQALYRQKLSGIPILPRLHGIWSMGALLTAIIAVGITSHVTLAEHIDVGVSLIWALTMYSIYRTRDVMLPGSAPEDDQDDKDDKDSRASVKSILTYLREEWLIVIAMTMGIFLEMSTNDWASLFTKEDIKASSSLSILSYIAFGSGMILGRLNLHRFYLSYSERFLIKMSALSGGASFIILIQIASQVAPHHHAIGLMLAVLGFLCGGLGSSFMSPGMTTIATRHSRFPAGFVVAQLALVNTAIFFVMKIIISWVAQATSITTALMIPGAVLLLTALFANLGSEKVST
jgi:MFS family permease